MKNNVDHDSRKQILKCILLSAYLILMLTFHPRSSEVKQEHQETQVELNSEVSNSSIFFQENSFNNNEILNFDNLESRFTIPVVSIIDMQKEQRVEESLVEETNNQISLSSPTDFSFMQIPYDYCEDIAEKDESSQILEESEVEVVVEYNYQEDEPIEQFDIDEVTSEDPELLTSIQYDEEIEVVEEISEDLEFLAEITEEQPAERIYHPTKWTGGVLTAHKGVNQGPSGKETYYNLPMDGIVDMMHNLGYNDEHWIREDGVHMLGEYVMVAANLSVHPRGSIVETSLGMGIVADTGGFARKNPTQLDIATTW